MTVATLTKKKKKHLIGVTYIFRGLVQYCHGRNGGVQADMVLVTS